MVSDLNINKSETSPLGDRGKKVHPYKFTLWVAVGSIVMMFAGLTSAFIVKSNQTNWKPVTMPKIFWASTVVILLSSVALIMAIRSFKNRAMTQYRLLIGTTLILGIVFLALQWMGFQQLWSQGITFKGAGAGQFLYVIFGLHALHVLGGVVALLVMFVKAFLSNVKLQSSVPVEVAGTYWHFVDLLWIYLMLFFLIIGS
ncbi:MAG: cytochrome c oxidase subunit 3 [Chitinophagaceae bacterium]